MIIFPNVKFKFKPVYYHVRETLVLNKLLSYIANMPYVSHMKNDTEHNDDSCFSLLEGASKPIDNDEEESYKAAFAGEDEFEEVGDENDDDGDGDDVEEDGEHEENWEGADNVMLKIIMMSMEMSPSP